MDTISLVLTIAVLISTAIVLSAAADWLVTLSCPHRWVKRGIYGDQRLHRGHHEEWICEECGAHRYKEPNDA